MKSIDEIFPKEMRTNKIKNEIDEIQKWEEKSKRKDLKYETKNTYMIFSNMKQKHLLVKVLILVKLK